MLSRARRVPREAIPLVLARGSAMANQALLLKVLAVAQDQPTAFAVVVSGKVAKKAVDRNRIKRRARAILARLNVRPGLYGVLVFRKNVATIAVEEFTALIIDLVTRAKILISPSL